MHIKNSVLLASAALAPIALALEAAAASNITRLDFVPTNIKAPFLEQFTDDWESRWQASHAKKDTKSDEEEWAYVGTWKVEEPLVFKGLNGDKGLVLKDKAAHHAISAKFPTAIDNTGKSLVVQYEVKLQDLLECGGAYMKLLKENAALHADEFSNASPYVIMFGPDKCGSTNKVHFIFKHKNPITGEYEEKHMTKSVSIKNEKTSTLYTLIVDPDQSFELKINGETQASGSLLEDFAPAVNPSKEIDDPNDSKPSTWVDEAKITDSSATKPSDWDEDAPFQIVDEAAEKPADWLENEPQMVPDPEAEKPEDWDDEEDGDFVPPMVPNPKCADASGCGPWEKPLIKNEAYKGKWTAPLIDNPLYKGIWAPAKIANPSYFEDKTPSNFEPIGGIGFEIWTMQKDILFDNIYIGHSIEDALRLKSETFDLKLPFETQEAEAAKPVYSDTTNPKSPLDLKFLDDPVTYVREKVELFITLFQRDPLQAIQFVPEVAGAIGLIGAALLALIFGGLFGGAKAAPQVKQAAAKVKETVKQATQVDDKEAREQAADAIATGAENARAEAKKRQTRSSATVDGTS